MPKARGSVTAYNLFVRTCREELRRKYPQLNVDYNVISRKCSERWKGMNDHEKKRFYDTADYQRKRHDDELIIPPQTFLLDSSASSIPTKKLVKKKERKVKDPHAPKKPLSAYFLFCADERPKLTHGQTGMSVSDVARELGARWKTVPAEVKSKYEQLSLEQKDLYRNEMANYKPQPILVNNHTSPPITSEDYSNSLSAHPLFLLDQGQNYHSSFDLSHTSNEFEMIPTDHQT